MSESRDDVDSTDVSHLVHLLGEETTEIRMDAAWRLAELAADQPGRVAHVARTLVASLDDPDAWVRRGATWALAEVTDARPHATRRYVSSFAEGLDDDDQLVRESLVYALAEMATEYPAAVRPVGGKLLELLDDDDHLVRRHAADALTALADAFEELEPAVYPQVAEVYEGTQFSGDVQVFDGAEGRYEPRDSTAPVESTGEASPDATEPSGSPRPTGPPDSIPDVPELDLSVADLTTRDLLGFGRHALVRKASYEPPVGGVHVVALKTLRVARTDAFDAAFEQVLRRWRGVADHDHVVSLVADGTSPGYWVATEYMDDGTLADHVGTMGFRESLWVADGLVRAVAHAHARGVVHLGLKPENVLFTRPIENAWSVPKLTDWGLSGLLHSNDAQRTRSPYVAPEQLDAARFGQPDHQTDVYRLGCVLFSLFTGHRPVSGSPRRLRQAVLEEPPRSARAAYPDVPAELDEILARAMARHKGERYESIEDFRRALEVFSTDASEGR